jgi:2-polyprenyl-3-methyl-5-hydroxy-6-metoxy-1,4-benzoquinol methylase
VPARKHFREVLVGDAESLISAAYVGMQFDLILCLDVLEHMVDPWPCVEALRTRLALGGKLIISVPNVRCLKVLVPLGFQGRWSYRMDGILDRTHLRFFTRESALALATGSGLRVEACLAHRPNYSRMLKLHRQSLGLLGDFTARQFLIASSRVA